MLLFSAEPPVELVKRWLINWLLRAPGFSLAARNLERLQDVAARCKELGGKTLVGAN